MKYFNVARAELDDLLPELWEFCDEHQYEMHFDPCHHTIDISRVTIDDTRTLVATLTIMPIYDGFAVIRELEGISHDS